MSYILTTPLKFKEEHNQQCKIQCNASVEGPPKGSRWRGYGDIHSNALVIDWHKQGSTPRRWELGDFGASTTTLNTPLKKTSTSISTKFLFGSYMRPPDLTKPAKANSNTLTCNKFPQLAQLPGWKIFFNFNVCFIEEGQTINSVGKVLCW